MEQFDLFENFQEQYSVSVFNDRQTVVLQGLSKRKRWSHMFEQLKAYL